MTDDHVRRVKTTLTCAVVAAYALLWTYLFTHTLASFRAGLAILMLGACTIPLGVFMALRPFGPKPLPAWRCPGCGYDTRGLPEDHLCPECGHTPRDSSESGVCSECGYDLRGLPPGNPCPECGTGVSTDHH